MATLLRTLLNFIVAGALIGMLAVTLIYPRYKAWDNTPAFGKALCDCAETTRQTADGLIHAQLSGVVGGAGVGLVVGGLFAALRRRRAAARAASSTTPPAP